MSNRDLKEMDDAERILFAVHLGSCIIFAGNPDYTIEQCVDASKALLGEAAKANEEMH